MIDTDFKAVISRLLYTVLNLKITSCTSLIKKQQYNISKQCLIIYYFYIWSCKCFLPQKGWAGDNYREQTEHAARVLLLDKQLFTTISRLKMTLLKVGFWNKILRINIVMQWMDRVKKRLTSSQASFVAESLLLLVNITSPSALSAVTNTDTTIAAAAATTAAWFSWLRRLCTINSALNSMVLGSIPACAAGLLTATSHLFVEGHGFELNILWINKL